MLLYLLTHLCVNPETVCGCALPRCGKNEWIDQGEKEDAEQYLQKKRVCFCEQGIARKFSSLPLGCESWRQFYCAKKIPSDFTIRLQTPY